MRFLRGAAAVAAGLTIASSGPVAGATGDASVSLTGTYRRVAKEVDDGRSVRHAYDDLLVTRGGTYRLRLRDSQRPQAGATVRVSADSDGTRDVTVTGVQTLAPAAFATSGPTTTLAILAYWTAPDSVTQSRASTQLFGDDNMWMREASYGVTSLSGKVTPWVRIAAPTSGRCYDYADQIMARARNAAVAIGYDWADFDRTLVYFPRCSGSDTTNLTGWAFEPGDSIWLNGVMDRRTSVHEHGHSFGLGHARAYSCTSNGVRVTLGGTCTRSEYGDPYDAMGQSAYAGHYNSQHKDDLGWMTGRERLLTTSSATVTLAPFEKPSSLPLALVVNSPVVGRRYWVEYRQPVGFDLKLPAGGTAGVQIHLEDPNVGPGSYLLDPTPSDASFATAVLGSGRSWTAPDGVRLSVGAVSSTGATVSVSGARPEPVPPGVPRSVVATGGDSRVLVSWQPPASTGNGAIMRYVVSATSGHTRSLAPDQRSVLFTDLVNDRSYTFWVHAVNEAGDGPDATASATPRLSPPTVAITSPVPGSVVSGDVEVRATAAPGANSLVESVNVQWYVDGGWRAIQPSGTPFRMTTTSLPNGPHTVRAEATDENGRTASHEATYDVRNYKPAVAITSPAADYATVTGGIVKVAVSASPSEDGSSVSRVELFDSYGNFVGSDATAPYEIPWDVTYVADAYYALTAKAYDLAGRTASAVRLVRVQHASPTVTVTSPAPYSTVTGTSLTVAADATTGTPGVPIDRVEFYLTGYQTIVDTTAPYAASFDTSGMAGSRSVEVRAYETSGRYGYRYVPFTIGNPLPALTVTSPQHQASLSSLDVTISGTVAPVAGGAPVARVAIYDGVSEVMRTTPAADGTWSMTRTATAYGWHTWTVRATDQAGYRTQVERTFHVARPLPDVTLVAPAASVLDTTVSVDLVAAVTPAAGSITTVRQVCFRYGSWWVIACGEAQPDGTYAARGVWLPDVGRWTLSVLVIESDGYAGVYAEKVVDVYGAPPALYGAMALADDEGTVSVTWQPQWSDPTYAPQREYVVRDEAGNVVARQTWDTMGTPIRPARLGVPQRFSVEAVNEFGASPRAWTDYVTPHWATSVRDVSFTRRATTYPDRTTVKARLVRWDGVPIAGVTLRLAQYRPSGARVGLLSMPPTSSTGWTTLTYTPKETADAVVELPESGAYLGTRSVAYRVTVSSRVTGTLSRTAMTLGTTTWFSGLVQPATTGRTVYLQRYVSGAWRTVASRGQTYDGKVAFGITPAARGTYTYRLYYGGDGYRSPGWTPARTVTVS